MLAEFDVVYTSPYCTLIDQHTVFPALGQSDIRNDPRRYNPYID